MGVSKLSTPLSEFEMLLRLGSTPLPENSNGCGVGGRPPLLMSQLLLRRGSTPQSQKCLLLLLRPCRPDINVFKKSSGDM